MAFEKHLEETKDQAARLKDVSDLLGVELKARPCKGMAGLIEGLRTFLLGLATGRRVDVAIMINPLASRNANVWVSTCLSSVTRRTTLASASSLRPASVSSANEPIACGG